MAVKKTKTKTTKVYGYMRLSQKEADTKGNGFLRQQELIKEQYPNVEITWYKDIISGAKRNRPELDMLIGALQEGDVVIISEIARLSRSTKDLLSIVDAIVEKGAILKSVKDTWLDTSDSNPMGTFLLTVMGALAQMEREQISERIAQGVKIARDNGATFGRPKIGGEKLNHAIELFTSGQMSSRQVEKVTGVSRSTLMRRVREMREAGLITD